MPHARVWDLPGWTPPTTVGELATKPGIGYFSVSTPTSAIVTDVTGALYVRKSTSLRSTPSGIRTDWVVQASATGDGVALHIPRTVYGYVTRDDQVAKKGTHIPVAKVLQHQMLHYPKAADEPRRADYVVGGVPVPNTVGYTAMKSVGAGTGTVPLMCDGCEIGAAQVTWGNGTVAVEFLDTYGAREIANAAPVRGFRIAVAADGTTVTVLSA